MKKLNKKVFITLFSILSIFLIIIISIYNIQNYKKEFDNIYRNLNFIDDFKPDRPNNSNIIRPNNQELDNMMIMDYEVYTVKIRNNEIERIIGHTKLDSNFDIETIANKIINKDQQLKIGNLYNNKYSYNYRQDTLIIINTEDINKKLTLTLITSILFLTIIEILIYIITLIITKWITKPAEEAFNKQKEFIADASHELKTPLAVIMASSDELQSDKNNKQYIENIKYETERMNKLITSLLDLSKLENGITINSYKEENISKIVEKIGLTFESIAFEQNITIETNIEENIKYKCSKEEIEKLISILLDNAIKHSYKNSIITINLYKEKNINIEIINTGDPIKKEDEEKIFERFYRADKSRKRDTNRYGLGLAIAKKIVTNHNGIIKAFSKDGKTIFKISLKK